MYLRAVRPAHAVRGLEVVLAHQPAHPFLRSADSLDPELTPTRHLGRCRLPPCVDAGASAVPHPADPLQAVRPTRGDRVGAPHRLDLRRAKGPPASSWSTFAYSNSFSISSSPILGLQPTIVFVPGIRRPALQAGLGPRPETGRATARPAPR